MLSGDFHNKSIIGSLTHGDEKKEFSMYNGKCYVNYPAIRE